jgi:hypothetical protein
MNASYVYLVPNTVLYVLGPISFKQCLLIYYYKCSVLDIGKLRHGEFN